MSTITKKQPQQKKNSSRLESVTSVLKEIERYGGVVLMAPFRKNRKRIFFQDHTTAFWAMSEVVQGLHNILESMDPRDHANSVIAGMNAIGEGFILRMKQELLKKQLKKQSEEKPICPPPVSSKSEKRRRSALK